MAELMTATDTRLRERRTVELFGIPVDALTMDETIEEARRMVSTGQPHQHVVVNAAKIVQLDHDARLASVVRTCDLINADGTSVVWASRLLRRPLPERVTGIDLFERLVATAARDDRSVYFLGARPEIVQRVVEVLTDRHPGLRVAGYHDGYWDDDDEIVRTIRAAEPDYLFLAIPSPRKELWLNQHLDALQVPFVMGVGGSFDVIAGLIGRAPQWVQNLGCEWMWRLGQEPRRMFRRYLVGNTSFVRLCAREWWRLRP